MNAAPAPPSRGESTTYRIHVAGHMGSHWSARLDGCDIVQRPDGTTTITAAVADQAQLHGLLDKVRDLGLTLLGVDSTWQSRSRAGTATMPAWKGDGPTG